jgi:hypothetical protein
MTPEELKARLEELVQSYANTVTAYNKVLSGLSSENQEALFTPVIKMVIAYGNLQRFEQIVFPINPELIARD